MQNSTRIQTERLSLRPLENTDLEDFFEYIADEHLCRMAGLDPIRDKDTAQKILNDFIRDGVYAILCKENGKVIGNFAVEPLNALFQSDPALQGKTGVSLSFALSAAYQRRGFVSEVLTGMLDQLFLTEKLDFINCGYFAFNEPSRRLQEKFGFRHYLTHFVSRPGGDIETVENILFREDWLHRAD